MVAYCASVQVSLSCRSSERDGTSADLLLAAALLLSGELLFVYLAYLKVPETKILSALLERTKHSLYSVSPVGKQRRRQRACWDAQKPSSNTLSELTLFLGSTKLRPDADSLIILFISPLTTAPKHSLLVTKSAKGSTTTSDLLELIY